MSRWLSVGGLVLVLGAVGFAPLGKSAAAKPKENEKKAVPAAKVAFDKLKGLEGHWQGKSTKGWTERVDYDVIAGGSVIMERSFGAHPNQWMASMIHMDGDRLLLTHYCIAKNQPRLKATKIADDGSTITFEFMDATNLPSRDKGHMDKVVFKLISPDRFTSRWTWYEKGKESWMEEIEHRRMPAEVDKDRKSTGSEK